jgi:hypothetical protein
MKLRIRGNSIRLRLTQTEVANLSKSGLVQEKTDFGEGNSFIYSIKSSNEIEITSADFNNNQLEIIVPFDVVKKWTNSNDVGISAEQNDLKVLIEKDFNCLILRNNSEDEDSFPNPKSQI